MHDSTEVEADPVHRRPDLKIIYTGGNLFYVFVKDYNFSSSFDFRKNDKASGSSYLVMISGEATIIDADYSLVPTKYEERVGQFKGFRGSLFGGAALLPGYAYTKVYEKAFVSPAIFAGFGVMRNEYKVESGTITNTKSYFRSSFRLSWGYIEDIYFLGLNIAINISMSRIFENDGLSILTYGGYVKFFGGVHF